MAGACTNAPPLYDREPAPYAVSSPALYPTAPAPPTPSVKMQESCEKGALPLIGAEFVIYRDGRVEKRLLKKACGRPDLRIGDEGNYEIRILDSNGRTMWRGERRIDFVYHGPVRSGIDYSQIRFDSEFLTAAIPFQQGMETFQIVHGNDVVFSEKIE